MLKFIRQIPVRLHHTCYLHKVVNNFKKLDTQKNLDVIDLTNKFADRP
jgi:hypothetical protein